MRETMKSSKGDHFFKTSIPRDTAIVWMHATEYLPLWWNAFAENFHFSRTCGKEGTTSSVFATYLCLGKMVAAYEESMDRSIGLVESEEQRADIQGPKKWFAKCDKHYPSRSGQNSLATTIANFTKPRTSHFFDLCTIASENTLQLFDVGWRNITSDLSVVVGFDIFWCC